MDQPSGERARGLLERCAGSPNDFLGRLSLGKDLPAAFQTMGEYLAIIERREDPSPFRSQDLLRAWKLFAARNYFPADLCERIQQTLVSYVYRDFPKDFIASHRSENLRLSYMTNEYLTAATWPGRIFSHTQRPASEHYLQARNDLVHWTDWVGTYGFLEWDSSTYYGIDLKALLNLHDFAPDAFIRRRADWILSKLLLDMALKTYGGVYGASHGRCYLEAVTDPRHELTVNALPYFFGVGKPRTNHAGHALPLDSFYATTQYRPPSVLGAVAAYSAPMTHRQRNRGDDRYYPPPQVPNVKNLNLYTDVNLVTHRTAHGMLCSCQDYRPGEADHQLLAWQATLGNEAMVFAGVPARENSNKAHPHQDYWIDTASLPRVAQFGGTLAALYRPGTDEGVDFTHLYFPLRKFEEEASGNDWVAGRVGAGFVSVRCSSPLQALDQGLWKNMELRAAKGPAAYVCELGASDTHGTFEAFVRSMKSAPIHFDSATCKFRCHSLVGEIQMGWEGPVRVNGDPISITHFPHHDGPLARSIFGSGITEVECGEEKGKFSIQE